MKRDSRTMSSLCTKSSFVWLVVCGLAGCFSASHGVEGDEEKGDVVKVQDGALRSQTVLPDAFRKEISEKVLAHKIEIPESIVRVATVVRPRAAVREGPGTKFPVEDKMLNKGDQAILYEKVGVWQLVVIPATGQRGWVHGKVLSPSFLNKTNLFVDSNLLPTVIAVKPLRKLYSFPRRKKMTVEVPRGSLFRSLQVDKFGTLVWLADTNSVAWVQGRGVR